MDFRRYLLWIRPSRNTESDTEADRIRTAKTRNAMIKVLPRITEKDGKAVYQILTEAGLTNAISFKLWIEYLTQRCKHH